jgi:hypothetical protein
MIFLSFKSINESVSYDREWYGLDYI